MAGQTYLPQPRVIVGADAPRRVQGCGIGGRSPSAFSVVDVIGFVGDGFEIEPRWKEEVVYWEGDVGVLFVAGWGADSQVLYVPSAAIWGDVMPEWCRDRRDEIVARLRDHSDHELQDDVHGYYPNSPSKRQLKR